MCIQFMLVHFLSSVNSWLYYVLCTIMMLRVAVCVLQLLKLHTMHESVEVFCMKQSIFCLIINGLGKVG